MRRTQIERGEGMENDFKITLKAARVNKGFSQIDAANALGVSVVTLRSWEKGITFPNVEQIKKLEDVYSVEYKDIIFLQ